MKKFIIFNLLAFIIFTVPSFSQKNPSEFFGLPVGSDRTLVSYPDIIKYMKYLEKNSPRIRIYNEGQSTLNNSLHLVLISSEDNILNISSIMENSKKLANPDNLLKEDVDHLLKESKVVILITANIHSPEIASSQMSMILAHKLVKTMDKKWLQILEKIVILLMPCTNPDGNIMVTNWYKKHLNTPIEGGRMPYLYHHYSGHDNNRDFYMLNLKETKIVNRILHNKYFPQIYIDIHQMASPGPRMFLPPNTDPFNDNISPVIIREVEAIGSYIALKLQTEGKKGIGNRFMYDSYWPAGSNNTVLFKNVAGLLIELANAKMATPVYVDPNELDGNRKGLPFYKSQSNFPDPWPGGWWRISDIIEYEISSIEAILDYVSKNREDIVSVFLKEGLKNIKKGRRIPPYAYIISQFQWDQPELYTFLSKMQENGVCIYRLKKDLIINNKIYKEGSFIIPLDQPYRPFIKAMMEKQQLPEIYYEENGNMIRPYDVAGWTIPLIMGIKYHELNKFIDKSNLNIEKKISYPEEKIAGEGSYYILSGKFNKSFLVTNRLFRKKIKVFRAGRKGNFNPGDFLVKSSSVEKEQLKHLLDGTGVNVNKLNPGEDDKILDVIPPKIGIYQSYYASSDEGWTRWVLDQYEFYYEILHNEDFRKKEFLPKYDVIIIPDVRRPYIIDGSFRKAQAYPDEFKGGIGKQGIGKLKKFTEGGGTIILLDSSYTIGELDFGLPIRNDIEGVGRDEFYCPGSILRILVDNEDPLGWGLEKENTIFFYYSPAFHTSAPRNAYIDRKVVARFSENGPHLLSGYLRGGDMLDRNVMIVRFKYHKGNIIILGGRVQFRGQTFANFKFLFNSIFFSSIDDDSLN